MITNLNDLRIPDDNDPKGQFLKDSSIKHANVKVLFKYLKQTLIKEIDRSSAVVGCIAWLTEPEILQAIAKVPASIIVQKEDFLRKDINGVSNRNLRKLYDNCMGFDNRYSFNNSLLDSLSTGTYILEEPIRCVGNHNSVKAGTHPRMHNKFMVFLKRIDVKNDPMVDYIYEPYAVWTGSFNFTKNAGMSFENAVLIYEKEIAGAYYNEWAQISALSECLDWKSNWCAPEYRLGT